MLDEKIIHMKETHIKTENNNIGLKSTLPNQSNQRISPHYAIELLATLYCHTHHFKTITSIN